MVKGLKTASITERLASLGADRWSTHFKARAMAEAGEDVIELAIGEPDVPVAQKLIEQAHRGMIRGRTRYSPGRGEPGVIAAIAEKYSRRSGREITAANILCMPGTQAALAIAMLSLVEAGDAVLVPEPGYATYEGVVRATGADFVSVSMDAENGFHLTAKQIEEAMTPNARVLLLNTPHNPTGAVLSREEISAIGEVCRHHNLWIISDEVYEELIFDGEFASPFDDPDLADRTIIVSSISKSHAAPGFRSGWCVGPAWFTDQVQPVSESFLFGGQPFIADMTEFALREGSESAATMRESYSGRAKLVETALAHIPELTVLPPQAGMFILIDVSRTGLDGSEFAEQLLEQAGVGVMPGSSFGDQARSFIRLSLTVEDTRLQEAMIRISAFTDELATRNRKS